MHGRPAMIDNISTPVAAGTPQHAGCARPHSHGGLQEGGEGCPRLHGPGRCPVHHVAVQARASRSVARSCPAACSSAPSCCLGWSCALNITGPQRSALGLSRSPATLACCEGRVVDGGANGDMLGICICLAAVCITWFFAALSIGGRWPGSLLGPSRVWTSDQPCWGSGCRVLSVIAHLAFCVLRHTSVGGGRSILPLLGIVFGEGHIGIGVIHLECRHASWGWAVRQERTLLVCLQPGEAFPPACRVAGGGGCDDDDSNYGVVRGMAWGILAPGEPCTPA